MRTAIFAYIDAGGDGLDPPVKEAILSLRGHGRAPGSAKESSFQRDLVLPPAAFTA